MTTRAGLLETRVEWGLADQSVVLCGTAQRLAALLGFDHDEVVCASLRTLEAFVRKTHSASVRWQGSRELNGRLSALCQVWGGSDQVRRSAHGHVGPRRWPW